MFCWGLSKDVTFLLFTTCCVLKMHSPICCTKDNYIKRLRFIPETSWGIHFIHLNVLPSSSSLRSENAAKTKLSCSVRNCHVPFFDQTWSHEQHNVVLSTSTGKCISPRFWRITGINPEYIFWRCSALTVMIDCSDVVQANTHTHTHKHTPSTT